MDGNFTKRYRAKLEKFFAAEKRRREQQTRIDSEIIDAHLPLDEIIAKAVKRWDRTHCQECQRKKPSSRKRLCEECQHQAHIVRMRRVNKEQTNIRRQIREQQATRGYAIQSSLFHLLPIIRFYEGHKATK